MTSCILAATDLSVGGNHAAARAAQLAAATGGNWHLLHVIQPSPLQALARMLGNTLPQAIETSAQQTLQQLADQLSSQHATCAGTRVLVQRAHDAIRDTAARLGANLLVLGARGDNPTQLWLGSTTERVLHGTHRSLLAVRQPADAPYRRVLATTDFSAHARHALQLAATLAPQAAITLLHVYDAPFEDVLARAGATRDDIQRFHTESRIESERHMQAFIATLPADLQARITPRIAGGHVAGTVLAQARELDCDLLAIGKHGNGVTTEWLFGSVAMHVLRHAGCDVLAADNRNG